MIITFSYFSGKNSKYAIIYTIIYYFQLLQTSCFSLSYITITWIRFDCWSDKIRNKSHEDIHIWDTQRPTSHTNQCNVFYREHTGLWSWQLKTGKTQSALIKHIDVKSQALVWTEWIHGCNLPCVNSPCCWCWYNGVGNTQYPSHQMQLIPVLLLTTWMNPFIDTMEMHHVTKHKWSQTGLIDSFIEVPSH